MNKRNTTVNELRIEIEYYVK